MGINYPSQGEFSAAAYSVSATPFVTSSTVSLGQIKEINFGYVSKFLIIRNTSTSGVISIGFTENGLKPQNSNYFFLSGSESFSGDFRTDKLFVSGSSGASTAFTVISGLTTVSSKYSTPITASMGFTGVG